MRIDAVAVITFPTPLAPGLVRLDRAPPFTVNKCAVLASTQSEEKGGSVESDGRTFPATGREVRDGAGHEFVAPPLVLRHRCVDQAQPAVIGDGAGGVLVEAAIHAVGVLQKKKAGHDQCKDSKDGDKMQDAPPEPVLV